MTPPPRPLVKLCGLKTPDAVEAALCHGADWLGLVHFPKSPRHVTLETARALAEPARGRVGIVLLLVDPDDRLVSAAMEQLSPDLVQLHGRESPARTRAVREQAGRPVIKAVGVSGREDLEAARGYVGIADHILLDAKPPKGVDLPGGNGAVFDWSVLTAPGPGFPFILSGGLTPENVSEAIDRAHPFGVDVSSGLEAAPGVKDPARIAAFMDAVRPAGTE